MEAKEEIQNHFEEMQNRFRKEERLTGVYLVLLKYVNEWISIEEKITNLILNAYIYKTLKDGEAEIVLEAIEMVRKEQYIILKAYPKQEEEIQSYISCLNIFEDIVKKTVINGFYYYDNLTTTTLPFL